MPRPRLAGRLPRIGCAGGADGLARRSASSRAARRSLRVAASSSRLTTSELRDLTLQGLQPVGGRQLWVVQTPAWFALMAAIVSSRWPSLARARASCARWIRV
jgi:hypothetical protein